MSTLVNVLGFADLHCPCVSPKQYYSLYETAHLQ